SVFFCLALYWAAKFLPEVAKPFLAGYWIRVKRPGSSWLPVIWVPVLKLGKARRFSTRPNPQKNAKNKNAGGCLRLASAPVRLKYGQLDGNPHRWLEPEDQTGGRRTGEGFGTLGNAKRAL